LAFVTESGSVLLNPSEKGRKYSIELKHGRAITNDGKRKIDKKTGMTKLLTKEQLAYRAGYLAHQKDSNNAFRFKHPRYKRKTKN
jgi:hypothetical protein